MALFLHKQGYNFFNINALTYSEVNWLIEAWNREQSEKEKSYKAASNKKKK
jgi:hypothetical protein